MTIYRHNFLWNPEKILDLILNTTPWEDRVSARRESFQSAKGGITYTYGNGPGRRTYTSIPYTNGVKMVSWAVDADLIDSYKEFKRPNACFLNCYMGERNALGWHSDDFENMDHSAPVIVVSLGEERDILFREKGKEEITKITLGNGSMLIMPPGMQQTHDHRIPKGGRVMSPRVSLTFRRFLEDEGT